MNEIYEYIKNEVKGIPCTVSIVFDTLEIYEDELVDFLIKDNSFHLITFDKNQYFQKISKLPVPNQLSNKNKNIKDHISYFYKVNNQLYIQYTTINNNILKTDKYFINNMFIYSSINNKNELLKFTEKVGDFLKNK